MIAKVTVRGSYSLELGVLGFLLVDGNVGIGVLREREEILAQGAGRERQHSILGEKIQFGLATSTGKDDAGKIT